MSTQASHRDARMASPGACPVNLDVARLRRAIRDEYAEVATDPAAGFVDVRLSEQRWDAFGGSPSESGAHTFGTEGVAITARKTGGAGEAGGSGGDALPKADSVLDAFGEGRATLTPRIRARLGRLESGQVLEVVSDDPAARDGISAWSRLTGNPLLATGVEGDRLRFSIRKI